MTSPTPALPWEMLGVTLLLLVASAVASRGLTRPWQLLALTASVTVALFTASGPLAYAAVGAAALVHATEAWRTSRTGAWLLAVGVGLSLVAAVALDSGHLTAAFLASILAIALRTGVLPLHVGTAALINTAPALHTQQLGTATVLVFVHLRFVDHHADAVALAPMLVRYGAAVAVAGSLLALVQRDLRGFFRATTVMHAGMLLAALGAASLGFFAAALLVSVSMALALGGFGLTLAALEARVGVAGADTPGGLAHAFPRLAAACALFAGAGVAVPGTTGFVADDLLLHTLWAESPASTWAVIVASALLAVASLMAIARVFLGPATTSRAPDLRPFERASAVALLLLLVTLGLVPGVLLGPADALLSVAP